MAQDRETLDHRGARAGPGAAVAAGTWCRTGTAGIFHIAYWDRFGHPDKPIREGFNFDTWWVDAAKAAATDAARSQ